MYLKSLDMLGFKSFADKTTLEFLPGVTAIVGPNGCGKSNVSDALRWVLGEQSAKALRGGEMADVIFNGADTRKPIGMAEVSLTFAECANVLKTGALAGTDVHFDEVKITRRVFRDGNSEYLINQTPCRLKDIQNLFMDTGIGRSSYSIMEQGKIDKILSSHPEDRRAIFEEAAGITKFKSQKREALRKLEYTEANLIRVTDIIREVKRQINSLQRQVQKARRYQSLLIEIKLLDTQLARRDYEQMEVSIRKIESELALLQSRTGDLRHEIDDAESSAAESRVRMDAVEQRRQAALQRQRDHQSETERQENRIRHNTDRITETNATIHTHETEASEARSRLVEVQGILEASRAQLHAAREQVARHTAELEEARASLEQADRVEREHQQHLQTLQSSLLQLEGSLAGLQNQISALEKQRQDFAHRIQKLSSERATAMEQRQQVTQQMESLQTEINSYKQTFELSRHAVLGGEDALREAEQQCQSMAGQISAEQRLLSEKTSRRDVLRQLQESYEGYSEGAQALLRHLNDSENGSKILGTLANLIEVDPRYAAAIEASLGQGLQSIVVSQFDTALKFIEDLRLRELGRAQFAVQEDCESSSSLHFKREPLFGSIAWAGDVVDGPSPVKQFLGQLLADTVIVDTLQTAIRLRRDNPGVSFVTLDGDILEHHGILSAGSRKASPLQLIGRRNEIASLDIEIRQLEQTLHELSASKGEWEGRRALSRQALGDRQMELRFQENDLTKKETLVSTMHHEIRDLEARMTTTSMEIQDLERQRDGNDLIVVRLRHELEQTSLQRESALTALEVERARHHDLAAIRQQCGTIANDLRVLHATHQQHIHGLENQISPLESQIAELHARVANRESECQACRQRVVQWEGENAEATRHIEGLREVVTSIIADIASLDTEKNQADAHIRSATDQLRDLRSQLDDLQKSISAQEVKLAELRGERTHLSDRILREYNTDLTTLHLLPLDPSAPRCKTTTESAASTDDQSEEESSTLSSITPVEQTVTSLAYESWDAIVARAAAVREKIQSMGSVNLEAVQEYDELHQRFTLLTRENEDLVTGKQQLLDILTRINTTSHAMFAETFANIRENFQSVFTELFGGGKADLILMDADDPLESGIDIVAKPPGKQLQSITLLSGGEKTMTAVSLLFAIYMVKPSPFCVLDEMDAPLDESNINRFIKMLERFLEHSQFVIITHNKRTIGMADALYGVTMEERGVSKVVSVKFEKSARNETTTSSKDSLGGERNKRFRPLVDAPSVELASS